MRYPAAEKLEIIRLVEQSPLPVRHTLAKLGIPDGRPSTAGTTGIAAAGRRPWTTARRGRIGCGTAFRMACVTTSSSWRSTSRHCRRASWRCA